MNGKWLKDGQKRYVMGLTTTVAKEDKKTLRERVGDWIYTVLGLEERVSKTAVAAVEAAYWEMVTPCVLCHKEISKYDAHCPHCGYWQAEPQTKQATSPLYAIELENKGRKESLPFQRSHITGQLQINGERPYDAYRKKLRELLDNQDSWTR